MPQFRTSNQLLKHADHDDFWDENFMERYDVYLPPTYKWDYKKDMQFEDVQLWELIYEESGLQGLYASYIPYAEFYLLLTKDMSEAPFGHPRYGSFLDEHVIQTFYGPNCLEKIKKELKIKKINWPIFVNQKWVDEEEMWLYENKNLDYKKIIY